MKPTIFPQAMPRLRNIAFIILFATICYFPIFLHLDSESLFHWDEARNGLNALEMEQNGNLIVRYYQGEPETWETKPPLLIWLQVLSFKIVGYNELAIRLPSALAAVFTIFLIVWFFVKELKDPMGGFIAGLVLVCTQGYIDFHVVRTGDHDALLAFFQTAIVIYGYKFLRIKPHQTSYLAIVTIALIFSVLTKSIMGLAMLPGILLYSVFKKQIITLLRQKQFWLAFSGFVAVITGYYFLREHMQPGYLQLVWENELFPRYFNTAESVSYNIPKSRFYYLQLIAGKQFFYFSYFFVFLLVFIFLSKAGTARSFAFYLINCAVVFLVLISGGTINSWYDAPVFPLLAMLSGLGLTALLSASFKVFKLKTEWKKGLVFITFILLFFSYPYYKIIEKVYHPNTNPDKYGKVLEKLSERDDAPVNLFVFYTWRNSSFLFYEKIYKEIKGWKIESCGVQGNFGNCRSRPLPNQKTLICNNNFKEEFEKTYQFRLLEEMYNCRLYEVLSLNEGNLKK